MVTVDLKRAKQLRNFVRHLDKDEKGYSTLGGYKLLIKEAVKKYVDRSEIDQFMVDLTAVINGWEYDTESGEDFYPNYQKEQNSSMWIGHWAFEKTEFHSEEMRNDCLIIGKCDSGWKLEYRDDSGNQAAHFWYFVAVRYFDGEILANLGNIYHETYNGGQGGGSWADYYLGLKGNELGYGLRRWKMLNDGEGFSNCTDPEDLAAVKNLVSAISLSDIPKWIDSNLSE